MTASKFAGAIACAFVAAPFLAVVSSAQTAGEPAPATSVAIDPTLYREGAIKRFSGERGQWNYVCDEVIKLKQRFCSLRTSARTPDGETVAGLTVSTGQDGRPAALLKMAAHTVSKNGIEVAALPAAPLAAAPVPGKTAARTKEKTQAVQRVYPASCADGVCQLIWTLAAEQIAALNSGLGLKVRSALPSTASSLAAALKQGEAKALEFTIAADGFAAAVDASVAPLE